jgi:peptidoglycan/LPS O-acetylase OafA/YrhL
MDATRGIAAICVMFFHFSQRAGTAPFQPFPSGTIAVDYFFCLSGFVIAYSYGEKLDAGLPLASFLKLRLIRLYPMYILGTLIGIIASIGYCLDGDGTHFELSPPLLYLASRSFLTCGIFLDTSAIKIVSI